MNKVQDGRKRVKIAKLSKRPPFDEKKRRKRRKMPKKDGRGEKKSKHPKIKR